MLVGALHENVLDRASGDGLAEGHHRRRLDNVHALAVVVAKDTHAHLKVQVASSADDELAAILLGDELNARVSIHESTKTLEELG